MLTAHLAPHSTLSEFLSITICRISVRFHRYAKSLPSNLLPLLAVPHSLAADSHRRPIVFCLNPLDHKLTHAIILNVATKHSVLGNTAEPITSTTLQTATILFLTKPIDWVTHFVALCLYVSAMISVFSLLSALRFKQELSLSTILVPLQQSFGRLVAFSLKLLIVIGIGVIPFVIAITVFFRTNSTRFISIQTFSYVFAALSFSTIAYLISPQALKLLRPMNSEGIAPETARLAKISAVLTVITSIALFFTTVVIKPSFIPTSAPDGDLVYEMVASLVSATPYTVLFIALSLLARKDEPDSELLDTETELLT